MYKISIWQPIPRIAVILNIPEFVDVFRGYDVHRGETHAVMLAWRYPTVLQRKETEALDEDGRIQTKHLLQANFKHLGNPDVWIIII